MSAYAPHIWNQLKSITADEIVSALKRDDWVEDGKNGAIHGYRKGSTRVTIHYHPQKTYGAKLLKGLLDDIGWSADDMKRLKLVK